MTGEQDSRAIAINALDYYWDPETWLFPPLPLIPLVLEGVLEQQIEVILICPGWEGAMWWPQLVRNGSNPTASSGLPQVSQGEYRGAPQLGSTVCFSHQRESCLESGGNDPDILDDDDQLIKPSV